ncbi:MAG TPA: hypothetical protein VF624_02340 [Tepidisphaeraceae bacterium]
MVRLVTQSVSSCASGSGEARFHSFSALSLRQVLIAGALLVAGAGCQATPVAQPVNKADKTPNEAPAGAIGEPASRPATVEPLDAATPPQAPMERPASRSGDQVEVTRQSLSGFAAQTLVARGPLPLVDWTEAGSVVRVVNEKGESVAEAFVARRQIVRVGAEGVFASGARLSKGRLPAGEYQILLIAEGSGEVRQERRNLPPRPTDTPAAPPAAPSR